MAAPDGRTPSCNPQLLAAASAGHCEWKPATRTGSHLESRSIPNGHDRRTERLPLTAEGLLMEGSSLALLRGAPEPCEGARARLEPGSPRGQAPAVGREGR